MRTWRQSIVNAEMSRIHKIQVEMGFCNIATESFELRPATLIKPTGFLRNGNVVN